MKKLIIESLFVLLPIPILAIPLIKFEIEANFIMTIVLFASFVVSLKVLK